MRRKYGFRKGETPPKDSRSDENVLRVMRSESDCTAWEYPFYAVDGGGMYVLGFDDPHEADLYCTKNKYAVYTLGQACLCVHKPNTYRNWKNTYPTEGLL